MWLSPVDVWGAGGMGLQRSTPGMRSLSRTHSSYSQSWTLMISRGLSTGITHPSIHTAQSSLHPNIHTPHGGHHPSIYTPHSHHPNTYHTVAIPPTFINQYLPVSTSSTMFPLGAPWIGRASPVKMTVLRLERPQSSMKCTTSPKRRDGCPVKTTQGCRKSLLKPPWMLG